VIRRINKVTSLDILLDTLFSTRSAFLPLSSRPPARFISLFPASAVTIILTGNIGQLLFARSYRTIARHAHATEYARLSHRVEI